MITSQGSSLPLLLVIFFGITDFYLFDMEKYMTLTKLIPVALCATFALSGCSVFRVYTIDLPQGTPITAAQASQIKVGMSQDQVLYLLGSPAMRDTLNPNRFDYIYNYKAGTDGRKEGKKNVKNAEQYMSIFFENGRVVRILGRENLRLTPH